MRSRRSNHRSSILTRPTSLKVATFSSSSSQARGRSDSCRFALTSTSMKKTISPAGRVSGALSRTACRTISASPVCVLGCKVRQTISSRLSTSSSARTATSGLWFCSRWCPHSPAFWPSYAASATEATGSRGRKSSVRTLNFRSPEGTYPVSLASAHTSNEWALRLVNARQRPRANRRTQAFKWQAAVESKAKRCTKGAWAIKTLQVFTRLSRRSSKEWKLMHRS